MGCSRRDLLEFPSEVRQEIGYALHLAQEGNTYHKAKALKGFSVGVMEIVSDFKTDTYRAIYTTKIDHCLYVLHAFQKKSKSGIKTPKKDIEMIDRRLQEAIKLARGKAL
jgi:phage-related protein